MPEKSVREMSALERKAYSLEARVWNATILNSAILGIVALAVGLSLYTGALVTREISEGFSLSRNAAAILDAVLDVGPFSDRALSVYRALTDEERAQMGTEAYRAHFAGLDAEEDYQTIYAVLNEFLNNSEVYDLYLAMYDRETDALVYIVDPGQDVVYGPGDWEEVERKETDKFLSWDGEGQLYDIGNTDDYGWMCTSGVPVRNSAGETVAFVLADVTLGSVARQMKNFLWQYTLAMVAAVSALAYLSARKLRKTVVVPINQISDAARAYMADKRSGNAGDAHFRSLNIKTGDEIENLSLIMADMETELADYIENLTAVTAEKERIGAELDMAANIQAHALPNMFPAFPGRKEFDLYATMEPAKEVGGDFYDFFMIGDDHLGIVVADVSGKGVPAALFSMIAKTMLKTQAQTRLSPERVLLEVNASLSENNDEDMFVTVWLGVLEISTGELTYADAGHEKLLLYQNGAWKFLPKAGGPALAMWEPEDLELMDEKYQFRNQTVKLNPGDAIFQYTDGVTEATDADNELFGDDRLLAAMNSAPSAKPEELLPHVRKKIDEFVKDAPQFDDITMLGLRYKGTETAK